MQIDVRITVTRDEVEQYLRDLFKAVDIGMEFDPNDTEIDWSSFLTTTDDCVRVILNARSEYRPQALRRAVGKEEG